MRVARPWRQTEGRALHPLARQVFQLAREQRASLLDIADRSGVHYQTMVGWRTRYSPTVVNLDAVANVLGYRVALVPIRDDP